jgi:hypothetical protein
MLLWLYSSGIRWKGFFAFAVIIALLGNWSCGSCSRSDVEEKPLSPAQQQVELRTKPLKGKLLSVATRPTILPATNSAPQIAQFATTRPHIAATYQLLKIDEQISSAAELEIWLKPYRTEVNKQTSEVLLVTAHSFTRGQPECTLGNLIADISLRKLHQKGIKADLFITNIGGIRNDLSAGPITVGKLYEILPFENTLWVAQISGRVLQDIFDQLAVSRGEPVAGARFKIDRKNRKAIDIQIGGQALSLKRSYYLGTNDYLANTGWLSKHLKHVKPTITDISLRDAVRWGMVNRIIPIVPKLDGRVQYIKQ